jgi:uncharacterized protein involved in exopolysaccharide biosynthesis
VPVITVVERPALPARPDSRRVALKGVLALLLGGLAALALAVAREAFSQSVGGRLAAHGGWRAFVRAARVTPVDRRG